MPRKSNSEETRDSLRRRLLLLDALSEHPKLLDQTWGNLGRLARIVGCTTEVLRRDLTRLGWLPRRSRRERRE